MRIWDIDPSFLCRQHLLGEHRELHGLWNILTKHDGKGGYAQHPETKRWVGRLRALYIRHEALAHEMEERGYTHKTPLDKRFAKGKAKQDIFIDSPKRQWGILKSKRCDCPL